MNDNPTRSEVLKLLKSRLKTVDSKANCPPSLARVKAMLKQCRVRGGGGCNCSDQCKAEAAAEGGL